MTTICLDRASVYLDIAKLDLGTGRVEFTRREDVQVTLAIFYGKYDLVDDRFVAFYIHPHTRKCHFRYAQKDIELTEDTNVSLRELGSGLSEFAVDQLDGTYVHYAYQTPVLDQWDRIAIDMGDAEEESFDIFLWFANVWNDPDRRELLFQGEPHTALYEVPATMFSQHKLSKSLGAVGSLCTPIIFHELANAYQHPSRHYHTDAHIAACLIELESIRHLALHPDEIAVAIWFHDAVYDSRRSDNEVQSAAWATSYLTETGASKDVIARITAMILATKSHDAHDVDSALMVDIDLHILGRPPSIFEAYDHAIRQEYAWVPESEYRRRRAEALLAFLARDAIFRTQTLHERYEVQARENIQRKIGELVTA